MENVTFEPIRKWSRRQWRALLPLWLAFCEELQTESEISPSEDLKRRVNIQGSRPDMHFDLLHIGKRPVGFVQYAIDQGTIGGRIEPNGGAFLAFYVAPALRRRSYGRRMFLHCAEILYSQGARFLYCCPSPAGEPFWRVVGFADSGVIDPDDHLPIYVCRPACRAELVCRAMTTNDLDPNMLDNFVFNWPQEAKTRFIRNWFIHQTWLRRYYPGQPRVFAAFNSGQVLAFATWCEHFNRKDMAELTNLYVSADCRRMGLGRELFMLAAEAVRAEGFQVLYISAKPALETQAFYKAMGCVPLRKELRRSVGKQDGNVALEYPLDSEKGDRHENRNV